MGQTWAWSGGAKFAPSLTHSATRDAQQASMTQWGGSFYPIYISVGNLSHKVWKSEKAAHLWALLPVFVPDPALVGTTDPVVGDVCHAQRMEVQNACMGLLTMQLDHATRHGVRVVEEGRHICILYPHAWGNFVDRAELAGCTATHYSYLVECACAHCLVPRSLWVQPPWQPRGWWNDRRRCRSQMLLLVDEDMPTNKCVFFGGGATALQGFQAFIGGGCGCE